MKKITSFALLVSAVLINLSFAEVYNFKDYGKYYYSGRDASYSDGYMFGVSGKIEIVEKLKHRVNVKVVLEDKVLSDVNVSIRLDQIVDSVDAKGLPYRLYVGQISDGADEGEKAILSVHGKWISLDVLNQYELFFDFFGEYGESGLAFGSGFAIDEHTIITNQHVISGLDLFWAAQYDAVNNDFKELEVVYQDAKLDIAVLKSKDSLVACEVDRTIYDIGEEVVAYGFPQIRIQGKSLKATKGIISSRMGYRNAAESYQIDAAVQPGNSGGPLARNDKIVGIVSSRLTGESQLVNYAIKSNFLGAILDVLKIQNNGSAKPKDCTYSIQGQSYRYYNERLREHNKVQNYIQGIGGNYYE